jgi:photosystem II stability/assembly factor-like uncharacterized protein
MFLIKTWRKTLICAFFVAAVAAFLASHQLRWRLWMEITRVPRMDKVPATTAGYTVEQLPFYFRASFARSHDIYFVDSEGKVYRGDDRRNPVEIMLVGNSKIPPRMIFVSAHGTIFVSGTDFPMVRSSDGGGTWEKSHDWSFWRMTEDEESHSLYAGNYSPKRHPVYMAKVFKSTDEGRTWQCIFADERLDHVHSVLWDGKYQNLYLSAGDGRYRGQAFSPDKGKTWHWINSGGKQGHTDVALTDRYVLWGSDDNLGRVLRASRTPVKDGKTILWQPHHHVWWIVAKKQQIYAGTFRDTGQGDEKYAGAFLLASADEGQTWQKLLEDSDGSRPFSAFDAESRQLSADGWLYCATVSGKAYRVRRTPK